ncbi:2-C-methyl-D-erythritol 4-phosphate cytidylyltransferase [Acidithiobacillus thiooxidans]|uniref:2-C-methyl-D-erythritol 4-phosphate cytidylyltransferase n=2 Tax=Acidithiobacillus thiooxidans TaxID=930 RepID=A0A1C2IBC7_ACITH|nr:2-C-methyl-D-erythritol 4-phosphate cytidylyltransferase [Acidithiobacillus thiooxidans]OCX68318.1 2-C-methyl-D-erythritol 4-phosphate cytidylyltransferase [Acidithiobacillus thiooxidans]OCX70820.1 2-C-methyl-D-erythritol 4-phosphate cytidylyltransferase [Acidithiobacillus thiooxidans]OCX73237.1 2-C-methyl-D-erythritol 4-phosphate cytidylyltransferase [Acidithiobacillus thiooxidans]OCX81458.1 2-C-methyl-D-erythritol 4-phosphate cytidylyltransferase [Acidithiobacillus thiooxidans]OCX84024.1 
MERIWVIIPAGGRGQRFGGTQAKQYVLLRGQPVLAHTLNIFLHEKRISGVQLVLPGEDLESGAWRDLLGDDLRLPLAPVRGGKQRADSVRLGLEALRKAGAADTDWVLVHDAARPCLRAEDLGNLLDSLRESPQGALLGIPVADTLKREKDGLSLGTVDREGLWRALTPQAFPLAALLAALQSAQGAAMPITDEASAMELQGWRPRLIQGHGDNIKITLGDDLALAAAILAARDEEK